MRPLSRREFRGEGSAKRAQANAAAFVAGGRGASAGARRRELDRLARSPRNAALAAWATRGDGAPGSYRKVRRGVRSILLVAFCRQGSHNNPSSRASCGRRTPVSARPAQVVVHTLSKDFRAATKVVSAPLPRPAPGQARRRRRHWTCKLQSRSSPPAVFYCGVGW